MKENNRNQHIDHRFIDNELDIIHGIEPLEYYLGIVFMHFAE